MVILLDPSVTHLKHCHRCGETKPVTEFWINRSHSDGLCSYCKPCNNILVNAWRSRQRFHQGVDRDAVVLIETEAELLTALTQPVPFYAPPPQD